MVLVHEVGGCRVERVVLSFPSDLLAEVDARATRLGQKRSQIVRDAVRAWVETHPENEFDSLTREQFDELLAEGYKERYAHLAAEAEEFLLIQAEATEATWRWDD